MRSYLNKISIVFKKAITKPQKWSYYARKIIGKHVWRVGDGGWAPLPQTIKLYINARCNARCIMCDIGKKSDTMFSRVCTTDGRDMPLELFKKIVGEVKSFASVLNIAGVEPLLHKDIIAMVHYAKNNKLRIVLNTNGILLEEYAEDLAHSNIESIQVSIDGLADIHDRIRGIPGAFAATIKGLQLLRRLNHGIHIQVNCCINDINQAQLSNLLKFLLSENLADHVAFIHPFFVTEDAASEFNAQYSHLGVATQAELSHEQLMRIDTKVLFEELVKIKELYARYGIEWINRFSTLEHIERYYHHPEQEMNNKWCKIPWTVGMIFSNGECSILNRCVPYITGNINDATFREIWYGEKYKAFRCVLKKSGGFSVCKRCCGVV